MAADNFLGFRDSWLRVQGFCLEFKAYGFGGILGLEGAWPDLETQMVTKLSE